MKKIFIIGLALAFFLYAIPSSADTIPDTQISIEVLSDGTPTFDVGAVDPDQLGGAGFDASANNNILKTQDTAVITINWSTGDISSTNMILNFDLPTGFTYSSDLPAPCLNGSTMNLTDLACNLGDQPGGQTGSFEVVILLGTVENASEYDFSASLTTSQAPIVISNIVSLMASSVPKVNLNIQHPDASQIKSIVNPNTTNEGQLFFFPITLEIAGDGKGSEPLNPSQDLEFRVDISNLPASHEVPDNTWAFPLPWQTTERCGPNDKGNISAPFGTIGIVDIATNEISSVDSGDWDCVYNNGLDSIDITVSNANLAPNTFPDFGGVPFAPFAPRKVILSGVIPVFIERSDLEAILGGPGGVGNLPDIEVSWINEPFGVSGVQNSSENPSDNITSSVFSYELLGFAEGHYFGNPTTNHLNLGYGISDYINSPFPIPTAPSFKPLVPTQTQVDNAGDGTVVPGELYQIVIGLGTGAGIETPTGAAVCAQFSPGQTVNPLGDMTIVDLDAVGNLSSFISGIAPPITTQPADGSLTIVQSNYLIPIGSGVSQAVEIPLLPSDYTIEYSTDTHNNDYDCSDNVYSWSPTPPLDLEDITQVRFILLRDLIPGEQITIGVGMKALPNPIDTKLYFTVSALVGPAGLPFDGSLDWEENLITPYNTTDYCLPSGIPDSTYNDCLKIGGPNLSILKQTIGKSRNLHENEVIDYEIRGYVRGSQPGVTEDVVINDVLPSGLEFVGDNSIDPTTGGTDGDTSASWDFGQQANGTTITINYKVRVLSNYDPFSNFINTATINGGFDTGAGITPLTPQSSTANVQSAGIFSSIDTVKLTSDPLIPIGGDLLYELNFVNSGSSELNDISVIDILPFNGDGRTEPSSFSGTASLTSVSAGISDSIYYTIADPSTIVVDANDPSNDFLTGSTKWCEEVDITIAFEFGDSGCPTAIGESTAFRVESEGPFEIDDEFSADVVIATSGNMIGDIYTNDFAIRAAGLSLPALSNDVSIEVEGGDLAITKTARSSSLELGSNITYDIVIENTGTIPAINVEVQDNLPAGLKFVSATNGGVFSDGVVLWTIPTIEVGSSVTLSITAETTLVTSSIINVAQVNGSDTPLRQIGSFSDDALISVSPRSVITIPAIGELPLTGQNIVMFLVIAFILIFAGYALKQRYSNKVTNIGAG